ncbi:MAG: PIN domain-containing protein [Bifidobacteriaceae bacterium]|jgi:predicted nucleic acid-binding protein|nr:PIN domain-containing protein [Bifidobacteriaceae bacterium]
MVDTNVLFSMILFPTDHSNRLKRALAAHQIVLCSYVVEETKQVVERKVPDRARDIDKFFASLPFTLAGTPTGLDPSAYPAIRGLDDLPVLAAAMAEQVDALVTGDKDFAAVDVDQPTILTPRQLVEQWAAGGRPPAWARGAGAA